MSRTVMGWANVGDDVRDRYGRVWQIIEVEFLANGGRVHLLQAPAAGGGEPAGWWSDLADGSMEFAWQPEDLEPVAGRALVGDHVLSLSSGEVWLVCDVDWRRIRVNRAPSFTLENRTLHEDGPSRDVLTTDLLAKHWVFMLDAPGAPAAMAERAPRRPSNRAAAALDRLVPGGPVGQCYHPAIVGGRCAVCAAAVAQ